MVRRYRRSRRLALPQVADLRACAGCGGLIEASMATCPTCGRWLGHGTPAFWLGLVGAGSLLVIAGFFLPWLDGRDIAAGSAFSGYDLAQIAWRLAVTPDTARPTAAASLALALVPVAGLAMLALAALRGPWRLPWRPIGRLIVGLAAIPCQLTLLAALFALGILDEGRLSGWPHIGLASAGLGSLLAIVGGIGLGGPGRSWLR